jgi:5-hydroxyisourate hydrolase-like protein (transthyretin family)
MPLRNLLFVFAAGLGWFARGATIGSSHAAASAAPVRPIEVRYPTIAIAAAVTDNSEPTVADTATDDSDTPDDESAGDDIGELLAKAKLATTHHNGVRGHVVDRDTGAPLRNVLVLVTREDDHERISTDEDGNYELDDVDAGTYTVSFAYGSVYTTHENITVSSFDLSTLDERIDVTAAVRDIYGEEEEMFEQEPADRENRAFSEETGE